MSQGIGTPAELRARVDLTKNEIAHLWNGGVLSLKIEGGHRGRHRIPVSGGAVGPGNPHPRQASAGRVTAEHHAGGCRSRKAGYGLLS
jgi:hypothetical protein